MALFCIDCSKKFKTSFFSNKIKICFSKCQIVVETPLVTPLLIPFSKANSELVTKSVTLSPIPLTAGRVEKSRKSGVLSCLSSQLAARKTTNQQRVTSMSELDRLHRSLAYPPARGLYSLRVIAFISSQK
ncbi:hypothetical protein NPIL_349071 [Nephila pilipes]|uniref:Uncharacterized protein n=1 Tax=Nephila pilipes TaxID=299642 RepID=A0A8X6UT48_NEPPI|nr:hypothetical protein NPIL_349071 [Nephila pilipes]